MNKILLLLLLTLLGCAKQIVQKSSDMPMTVDWTKSEDRAIPKIEKQSYGNEYGPSFDKDEKAQVKKDTVKQKHKSLALILGAGGYRSIGHISLLKEISMSDESDLKPNVIVGHGLSAVIASYYAFGYNPDYIEWKFFGFIRKVKDLEIFSSDWLNLYKSELVNELKNKKIEDSELTLILPVYSNTLKKLKYLKRGDLYNALLANVTIVKKAPLTAAFPYSFVNKGLLKEIGIENIIGVDLLSHGIKWKAGNGRINGLFEKAASQYLRNKESLFARTSYPLQEYNLDDTSLISKIVFISKEHSKSFIEAYKDKKTLKGQ